MKWIYKRFIQSLLTIYITITISFIMIRFIPGGPLDFMKAQLRRQGVSPGNMAKIMEVYSNLNPSKPIWQQYLHYITSMAQGNLGTSLFFGHPVSQILADAVPWTLFLMTISIVSIYIFGVILGTIMAYNESGLFDTILSIGSIISNSVPYYAVALILLFVFGYDLGWFPTTGRMNDAVEPALTYPFIAGVLNHVALPAASLILTGVGGVSLAMRGNSIQVLGEDYIRVAQLRGLANKRIALNYVGRNSILPLYTRFMISMGFLFGGSVVLETIFKYNGLGFYLFRAISSRDYPLMMGGFVIITVAVVTAIFIADITYGRLDPRAKGGETRESY